MSIYQFSSVQKPPWCMTEHLVEMVQYVRIWAYKHLQEMLEFESRYICNFQPVYQHLFCQSISCTCKILPQDRSLATFCTNGNQKYKVHYKVYKVPQSHTLTVGELMPNRNLWVIRVYYEEASLVLQSTKERYCWSLERFQSTPGEIYFTVGVYPGEVY